MFGIIFQFRRSTKTNGGCALKAKSRNVRNKFRGADEVGIKENSSDARVRREQPNFLQPKSKACNGDRRMGTRSGRRSVVDLARARGVKSGALEIIFEGADRGKLEDQKVARRNQFCAQHPIEKARDVLLAHK